MLKSQLQSKTIISKSSIIGIMIIAVLIGIAISIFKLHFHFNPAVIALSEKVVLPEREVMQKNSSEQDNDFQIENDYGLSVDSRETLSKELKPIVRLVNSLESLSASEFFNAETLSDKINGKAELYLPAGFKSLNCQRFTLSDKYDHDKTSPISHNSDPNSPKSGSSPQLWIEFFLYDMTLPENAFAVFSRQRRENSTQVPIATYAYKTGNALFFVHGHFYIEMVASLASEVAVKSMIELGTAFIEDRPYLAPQKMDVPELFPNSSPSFSSNSSSYFPSNQISNKAKTLEQDSGNLIKNRIVLDKDSITLITSDAFGFERFDNIYTATYTLNNATIGTDDSTSNENSSPATQNNSTITAFISKRNSSEEAAKLAAEYSEFLVNFGGNKFDLAIDGVYAVEVMETFELVFSSGQYIAGVRDSENLEVSKRLAREIKSKLNNMQKN